jgi:hypothetical protein
MADGSFETDVAPGISEFLWEEYHPVTAMIYGPAYLLGCWLAAQAYFRRSAPRLRHPMLLVSVGVLLAAWTAILGELIRIKPPLQRRNIYLWVESFFWTPIYPADGVGYCVANVCLASDGVCVGFKTSYQKHLRGPSHRRAAIK